jgi:predicted phosphodiesterase
MGGAVDRGKGMNPAIQKRLDSVPDKAKTKNDKLLDGIGKQFNAQELRAISRGEGMGRVTPLKVNIDFHGEEVRFGFFTDPHMGSIYYHESFMESAIAKWKEEKVDFVVCGGDVTHGMDARKYNLLYELTHVGYASQQVYAVEQLKRIPFPIYLIDGNHDRWFESVGGCIVEDICRQVPGATYLGRDEGKIKIGKAEIMVWHGEDGSSYATSYRIQKLIESLTGGEKPNVLLCGHTHKQGYFFERNIHAVSGGALSIQSRWMRSKRLACHSGYHTVRMTVNNGGVGEFTVTWKPFYA